MYIYIYIIYILYIYTYIYIPIKTHKKDLRTQYRVSKKNLPFFQLTASGTVQPSCAKASLLSFSAIRRSTDKCASPVLQLFSASTSSKPWVFGESVFGFLREKLGKN